MRRPRPSPITLVALALVGALPTPSAAAPDPELWIARAETELLANAGEPQLSTDELYYPALSWGEAYYQDALLLLFEATDDPVWLDLFVDRCDTALDGVRIGAAWDLSAWLTPRYSVNLLQDGDMEAAAIGALDPSRPLDGGMEAADPGDSSLPLAWTRWAGTEALVLRDPSVARSGGASLAVTVGSNWGPASTALSYTPAESLVVQAWARTQGPRDPRLEILDLSTGAVLATDIGRTTDWGLLQVGVSMPEDPGHDVVIRLYHTSWGTEPELATTTWFDDVAVYATGTLPSGWRRWQATEETGALDHAAARTGARGLSILNRPAGGWQSVQAPSWNPFVTDEPNYEPGARYRFDVWSRVAAGQGSAQIAVRDEGPALAWITQGGPDWTASTVDFLAPTQGGRDLYVDFHQSDWEVPDLHIQYDDARLRQWLAYAVDDARIAAPAARFAELVAQRPGLARFAPQADAYATLLLDHVLPRWEATWDAYADDLGVYVFPDDGSDEEARDSLPHNQYLAMVRLLLSAATLDPGGDHIDRAARMARGFVASVAVTEGVARWNYWDPLRPGETVPQSVEDVSHGGIDVDVARRLRERAVVVTDEVLEGMARAFAERVWNGDLTASAFNAVVDGSSSLTTDNIAGWTPLAAWDARVRDAVAARFDPSWPAISSAPNRVHVAAELAWVDCRVNPGLDDDADGWDDRCEPCPGDPLNDPDGDGLCAAVDPCPDDGWNRDTDGDSVCDDADACPGHPDADDADGDSVPDDCEADAEPPTGAPPDDVAGGGCRGVNGGGGGVGATLLPLFALAGSLRRSRRSGEDRVRHGG